ncbi:hypothetical protein EV383_5463 [Pseudonocardia sediminis]|uniref:Uncharacterized protein n=1 Tax=Pseudonocardia sediminis TaxID=1397368 RepID=A0A4V2FRG1_PSEST|nr:hypothetical protein [Pseudonocardia sediminis]RZT88520.1 hypothetical protein EV383_5463 [Pseudonocardia sediminis]
MSRREPPTVRYRSAPPGRVRVRRPWRGPVLTLVLLLAVVTGVYVLVQNIPGTPGCTVTGGAREVSLSVEQAGNAATIAGVGAAMGMPDHAVTVALATVLQESGLRNLPGGDRDSAGLFQQRPSQGWGTYEQVTDPVYASQAFYRKLRTEPEWPTLDVAEAAQLIQRSFDGSLYAQWEPQAATMAAALTGRNGPALTCHDLAAATAPEDVATVAARELGTSVLSGPQDGVRGWEIANWLVAHAARFGLERVTFDGWSWTAESGEWASTGPEDGRLSLQRAVG